MVTETVSMEPRPASAASGSAEAQAEAAKSTPVRSPTRSSDGTTSEPDRDQVTAAPTVEAPPGSTPVQITVNGLQKERIIVMSPAVRENVRDIYRRGLGLGRDSHAFSKLGASIIATVHFLTRWDTGPYDLGPYSYLQPAVDHFAGSFEWEGVGTRVGLHAWAVFNPAWANKELCRANENVIACELRLHNPSVLLIILGTNDLDPEKFEEKLGEILVYCIDEGVIPVLATKADRYADPDDENNGIIRKLATEYAVPLWDFDLVAATLPGRGIGEDEVHLTLFDQYDYTLEKAFERGYGLYNLTALMALEEVREEMDRVDREIALDVHSIPDLP